MAGLVRRLSRRNREGLVQAAKMAVAAVVAWLIARQVHEPQSFIAPYAAVLIMSGTVYRSLADAVRQVLATVLGVLVAFVVTVAVPWVPVALAVAVFAGMVVGRWHRLGPDGIWVGVIALLMITYGTADNAGYLVFRVGEGLLGAVVGVAVNVLVLPPVHLRDGRHAVAAVGAELAETLRSIAGGLRDEWDQRDAIRWRRDARALETAVRRAEEAARDGRESTRFNPRWAIAKRRSPPLSTQDDVLEVLYEVAKQVEHIAETLVASSAPDRSAPRTGRVFHELFAEVLAEIARAVENHQGEPDVAGLRAALHRTRDRRAALARREPWAQAEPPADWSAHAAMLLAAERAIGALMHHSDQLSTD